MVDETTFRKENGIVIKTLKQRSSKSWQQILEMIAQVEEKCRCDAGKEVDDASGDVKLKWTKVTEQNGHKNGGILKKNPSRALRLLV